MTGSISRTMFIIGFIGFLMASAIGGYAQTEQAAFEAARASNVLLGSDNDHDDDNNESADRNGEIETGGRTLFAGTQDQYGTRAQIEALEHGVYCPLDVEMLQDCKHSPHLEQQQATLNIIHEYIKRLDRIEAAKVEVA